MRSRIYRRVPPAWWPLVTLLLLPPLAILGCTRNHYRVRADYETLRLLEEKTAGTPWEPQPGYTVYPDPRSRFFDPTPPDHPQLPLPAPRLYSYQIPDLPSRNSRSAGSARGPEAEAEQREAEAIPTPPADGAAELTKRGELQPVAYTTSSEPALNVDTARPGAPAEPLGQAPLKQVPLKQVPLKQVPLEQARFQQASERDEPYIAPIPAEIWESLPASCLRRMFEFQSVRGEYERSFERPPDERLRDDSRRLALEDILQLALINSREYQERKERLYRAALALTLERYDYALKFSPFGNGTNLDYVHDRAGVTVNDLNVRSRVNGEQMLATGGLLIAGFANRVLMTFNGADGFDAEIGSDLIVSLSQTVFQRDARLESLTRAERNVVYAARDYARFRKTFFRDLAEVYYQRLLDYRRIEIESQNYFSNLRAFIQGEAEFREGRRSRIQVDQIEQDALRSRSTLIARCNALESGLDNLKLDMGLPTETRLNLNLAELDELTLRDEATVWAQLVRRVRRNLDQERRAPAADRGTMLNYGIDLARRLLNLSDRGRRLGQEELETEPVRRTLAEMRVDEARLLVQFNQQALASERDALPAAPPLKVFERTMDVVDALLEQIARQAELTALTTPETGDAERLESERIELQRRFERLREQLAEVVEQRNLEALPGLVALADTLLIDSLRLAERADSLSEHQELAAPEALARTREQVATLLELTDQILETQTLELAPVDISTDEAMITALVSRLELMNARGELADAWRQVKLAADDLKSVLDLNATQTIDTRTLVSQPFPDSLSTATTRLSVGLDTPLNRKAQRNAYRASLLNYQLAYRQLMSLEDSVKLAVRDDLRNLQLDREQYRIAVASAALAYERVVSTRLQLQLGIESVSARDFLEAQQAYTASLNAVADEHIGFIRDRIQLFLNLELLQVDAGGMWPELYDEQHQPEARLRMPAYPVYGGLPRQTWHSHKIRRMLRVPPGRVEIFGSPEGQRNSPRSPAEQDADRTFQPEPGKQGRAADTPAAALPEPQQLEPQQLEPQQLEPQQLEPEQLEPLDDDLPPPPPPAGPPTALLPTP